MSVSCPASEEDDKAGEARKDGQMRGGLNALGGPATGWLHPGRKAGIPLKLISGDW